MSRVCQYILFSLDGQRFALPLTAVERIVRAVEITPLPNAPQNLLGVINVHGHVVPVVNTRRLFQLPEREMDVNDKLIIAHSSHRTVVLPVDEVCGIEESSDEELTETQGRGPGVDAVRGVALVDDGMAFIFDLDRFLAQEEDATLIGLLEAK